MASPGSSGRRLSRTYTNGMFSGEVLDSEVVPSSLAPIATILRVANEIEPERPRVAYLCRFYAFEKAHRLDPTSSGRGVRQFKTALLQRLEKDNERSIRSRVKRSDAREIQSFYQQYYEQYVKALDGAEHADRAQLAKAYQTAGVLFEVLCAVNKTEEVAPEIIAMGRDIKEKKEIYVPYNILPLDVAGSSQAIMQLPEIKAAVDALRNIRGLPWSAATKQSNKDVIDWLKEKFGFQKDNVSNQREHLILLLANVHTRIQSKTETMNKSYVGLLSPFFFLTTIIMCSLPDIQQDIQQRKLLYMGLYLLIWGEAANLRFMPECLCYIFHNMALELHGMLAGNVSFVTGENIKPAYGGEDESFLRKVVTPIYEIIQKEAASNECGTATHSSWRNYDDLNEYFWSDHCFRLGWPMRADSDFFVPPLTTTPFQTISKKPVTRKLNKIGFVEIRSFWHIFRSFDRMWTFYILCLQAMIILAWSKTNSPSDIFEDKMLKKLSSIFITASILRLLQSVLDIAFTFKASRNMRFTGMLRLVLKFAISLAWVITLSTLYAHSWEPNGLMKSVKNWLGQNWRNPSLYTAALVLYLLPNFLGAAFFVFPLLRRWIENSNWRIVRLMLWWSQVPLYVGRGMHEDQFTLFKYTMFWILLVISKLLFSYYVQIKPLVEPTKRIMGVRQIVYTWHELFPNAKKNIAAVLSLWSPVILIYFMDTQIWYAIYSTLFGGILGAFRRLGEVIQGRTGNKLQDFLSFGMKSSLVFVKRTLSTTGKEMNLMLVPYSSDPNLSIVQWPPFLLASKIPVALQMAAEYRGKDNIDLWRKIKADDYRHCAVEECYEAFKAVIKTIIRNEPDKRIIEDIIHTVERDIQANTFLHHFKLSALPSLASKFVRLVELLARPDPNARDTVILLLQDMYEVVTKDMMVEEVELKNTKHSNSTNQLFDSVLYPPPATDAWFEQVNRLHLLLTVKESAMDVPVNLEARRRIAFFTNSLFMDMPRAPRVRKMLPFSVLTPYYSEDIVFTKEQLHLENEDGVSILFYLQKIYPGKRVSDADAWGNEEFEMQLRHWASFRGQTLLRTVRGMMYYRRALELQAFLDMASDDEILEGYKVIGCSSKETKKSQRSVWAQLQAVADMKFTYVATCQIYGLQKRSGDQRATDILNLMLKHPSLRVAYIDEVEETQKDNKSKKVYYSVLVKAVDGLDQEIYRIKLPGPAKLGEGKPENQNHAIIFTRGEALQTIDMNQDNYLEEAFKMRNLLEEFHEDHGVRPPSILGVREHIFTGSVSSLAWFMSNQETSFVTIGQRVLANPLKVRFHYGHPDVFDRLFHITRGGISKASKVINLSEDIFAGFNSTLRRGNVTHHEYIQVGKGRDVGLNQITLFEAKVANGNGEQTLSRDIYRLGHRFDFFRMMSCYFTTVGFYVNALIVVLTVYVFLYGRLYLSLSGMEKSLLKVANMKKDVSLQAALASQSLVQLGLLMALPMIMEIGLERGFRTAISDFIIMQLQLASVFFTFSLGTKVHYFGRTILHGGAKYRATGRGFVVRHERFAENYRLYSRSHFTKALELMILLIVYVAYGSSGNGAVAYMFITASMWFLVVTWLFAPFLFNPSGFEWQKIVEDWDDWNRWIANSGGIGIAAVKSWQSWWDEEHSYLNHTGLRGRIMESLLAIRFFLYQYGLVYHLNITSGHKNILIYALSWLVIIGILIVLKIVSMGRRRFSGDFQLMFRLLKGMLFMGFVSIIIILFVVVGLTVGDLFVTLLAFLPTGWALLQIGMACRPLVESMGFWGSVRALARSYEFFMGLLIFTPVAILAWFPFVSEFQTRLLFNQAFSRASRSLGSLRAGRNSVNETSTISP
ncbi:glucan synthase like 4 [Selaginella moellendorffii]|uniref:1,3-beta-glucan synthase n=1 Tax=Selaginella moellendorffii TaxID=88036 RepID=D8RVJ5_SELML|nr:glucan synthase like 4 [Selaginella moellendorffii]